ncbi:hypothetical protein D9M68_553940 [compost metagenome]
MKFRYILLILFLLCCFNSSFSQYVKYEVKVILDSVKNVRGTLQKVSPEGIAVEDYRGNYYIFRAEHLLKVKIRRKGLTVAEGLGTGAGIGLAAGAAIFFSDQTFTDFGQKLTGTALLTGVGAIGGTLGGLVGEALNTRIILNVHSDVEKFKRNYKKLEKYSKAYALENPVLTMK